MDKWSDSEERQEDNGKLGYGTGFDVRGVPVERGRANEGQSYRNLETDFGHRYDGERRSQRLLWPKSYRLSHVHGGRSNDGDYYL
jgi:hypothetical protein